MYALPNVRRAHDRTLSLAPRRVEEAGCHWLALFPEFSDHVPNVAGVGFSLGDKSVEPFISEFGDEKIDGFLEGVELGFQLGRSTRLPESAYTVFVVNELFYVVGWFELVTRCKGCDCDVVYPNEYSNEISLCVMRIR